MDFIRRVLGWSGEQRTVPSPLGFEPSMRQDSRATQTVLASLDIDAAINVHERWKARLMDYLEARSTEKMDLDVSDPPGPPPVRWATGCTASAPPPWGTKQHFRC